MFALAWPNILASYTPTNHRLGCGAGSARYARETHHVYHGRPGLRSVCASTPTPESESPQANISTPLVATAEPQAVSEAGVGGGEGEVAELRAEVKELREAVRALAARDAGRSS